MDVEETKKIIESKIEAEAVTKNVRSKIKSYIHEKQNLREGFKETFKPLISSQDKVKESIDKEQNALIEQLQKTQLALTEGLDKNRFAITQGFHKMDDVKKWDLQQLPGYEAIEYDDDDDDDDEDKGTFYEPPDVPVIVKIKNKDFYKILRTNIRGDPEEIIKANLKNIADKLKDFDYKYNKDENMITLVGKKNRKYSPI